MAVDFCTAWYYTKRIAKEPEEQLSKNGQKAVMIGQYADMFDCSIA
jgi:hypothetical protein